MNLNRAYLKRAVVILAVVFSGSLFGDEAVTQEKTAPSKGFRFIGGNPEDGKIAFNILNCIECHSIKGENVPAPPHKRRIDLQLAVEMRFVKRYEDLVLAITNPRHVMNEQYRAIINDTEAQGELEPLMPSLTDDMSAQQLMDLTAFLHQAYARELPKYGDPVKN